MLFKVQELIMYANFLVTAESKVSSTFSNIFFSWRNRTQMEASKQIIPVRLVKFQYQFYQFL